MRLLISILTCLVMAGAVGAETPLQLPIRNLRTPLERYEGGALKTRLLAKEASVPMDGGPIVARGVVIERLARDGVTVEVRIEADECTYSRKEQRGTCTGRVSMNAHGVRISGTGLVWTRGDELVIITADACVAIDRVMLPLGRIKL